MKAGNSFSAAKQLGSFLGVLLVFSFLNCDKKENTVQVAFYFWRTSFYLTEYEKNILLNQHAGSLYVRAFDVDFTKGEAVPLETIKNSNACRQLKQEVVPVVFITNRTFLALNDSSALALADKVLQRINQLFHNYRQLQIDCDWTEQSRHRYFLFLMHLQQQLVKNQQQLSCTIRLHQAKYPKRTGVPPVARGLLMVYNMGKLDNYNETNSIYNTKEAMAYLPFIKNYALPLDVALPLFSWQVHFRNQKILHLLSKKNCVQLHDTARFIKHGSYFAVKNEFYENGINFEPGDEIREEALEAQELQNLAKLVAHYVNGENRNLVFFDLDENNLRKFDESFYKSLAESFN